ncbi:hypothetical protein GCM10023214_32150 [Amycolatopsis dongchuanensis]|uniref:Uncharacterized protein n=1 Tax=Amycolatopsis dongchuanensis TaxID=1070866 RepID=A0ABP9QKZ5_9PSEU
MGHIGQLGPAVAADGGEYPERAVREQVEQGGIRRHTEIVVPPVYRRHQARGVNGAKRTDHPRVIHLPKATKVFYDTGQLFEWRNQPLQVHPCLGQLVAAAN